jgi:hypothetical protein
VHEGVTPVEVGAVRLVGQLAQLRVTLTRDDRHRVRLGLAPAGGALLLGDRRGLGLEIVVGAFDGALDELAVQPAVDDDRPAAIVMPRRRLCRVGVEGRGETG